jgi:hypothetical protein
MLNCEHIKLRIALTSDCSTVCFTDLDQGSKIIIFESILTTLIASVFLETAGTVGKIGSSL